MLAPVIGCCPPCTLPRSCPPARVLVEGTFALQPRSDRHSAVRKTPHKRKGRRAEKVTTQHLYIDHGSLQQIVRPKYSPASSRNDGRSHDDANQATRIAPKILTR